MIFAEPPRTQGDLHFPLLGIPVRIHPMFWLVTLLLGPTDQKPIFSVFWLAAVLVSILIHELGHAIVIRSFGYRPWIVLHGFGGLACHDPGEPSGRRPGAVGDIGISLAGPAAGFLLATVLVGVLIAAGYGSGIEFYGPLGLNVVPAVAIPRHPYMTLFLYYVFQVSVFWGLVNLLPVFPLDGGQVAQRIFVVANPRDGVRQSLILSVLTAGALAGIGAIQWHSWYMAIFFGYMAYSSYATLQAYSGGGRW